MGASLISRRERMRETSQRLRDATCRGAVHDQCAAVVRHFTLSSGTLARLFVQLDSKCRLSDRIYLPNLYDPHTARRLQNAIPRVSLSVPFDTTHPRRPRRDPIRQTAVSHAPHRPPVNHQNKTPLFSFRLIEPGRPNRDYACRIPDLRHAAVTGPRR